jgi:hypothetical protein
MGTANITTGSEIRYHEVPVVFYLNNGNAIILNIDPVKTEHHFKGLPVMGTVLSVKDESGGQRVLPFFLWRTVTIFIICCASSGRSKAQQDSGRSASAFNDIR